jgi:plasmid stabilization system protein ParE
MKRFKVVLHPDAEADITSIFEWGCRAWGRKEAELWIQQLRHTFRKRLTSTPLRCSIAPESDELGITIRQLIVKRYRILFIVEQGTVTVVHLKGAFSAQLATEKTQH